jgi:hypothetical protein
MLLREDACTAHAQNQGEGCSFHCFLLIARVKMYKTGLPNVEKKGFGKCYGKQEIGANA